MADIWNWAFFSWLTRSPDLDPVPISFLLVGVFLLAFGLSVYRYFFHILGAVAGIAGGLASRDALLTLTGLSENTATATVLIFLIFILIGIFLATRFRKILAFLAGLGTGAVIYRAALSLWSGSPPDQSVLNVQGVGPMELLAGLTAAVLFVLFEAVFALILTSAVGAALCTLALGGKWTFAALMLIGVIAQPLISRRLTPSPPGRGGNGGSRTITALTLLLVILLFPAPSQAALRVSNVNPSGRVVIDGGRRKGILPGRKFVILDRGRNVLKTVVISSVFEDSSFTEPLSPGDVEGISPGLQVVALEDYDFESIRGSGDEAGLMDFIDRYPSSRHRPEVEKALARVRFEAVTRKNTIAAYREFRRKYPGSRYIREVFAREEKIAFSRALEEGGEGSFRTFLKNYPENTILSGMAEARLYLDALRKDKVYACQDFIARFPDGELAGICGKRISRFKKWEHELEFGARPAEAIRFFGEYGDETAVPLLVRKLLDPELGPGARASILQIGSPGLRMLMEVLISPLQTVELKDEVVSMIAEIGDVSAVPALRTYVEGFHTEAGKKALEALEDTAGR